LKAVREKKQIIYKVNPSHHSRFLNGNLKKRETWSEVFRALNENNLHPRIL
jgi:hypothetical protein